MAFDGSNYGAVPLLLPYSHHPDAAPIPRLFGHALAGAYSHALNANAIGSLYYQGHPAIWPATGPLTGIRANDLVLSSKLVPIAVIEGYVPSFADRIHARAVLNKPGPLTANWSLRVSTPADTGSTTTGAATPGETSITEPLLYNHYSASAYVDLSATTLDDDVVVTVSFAQQTDEEDPADRAASLAKIIGVAVWWEANRNG